MRIVANGEDRPVDGPCTLAEFLKGLGFLPRSVVVELNGEAMAPSSFSDQPLKEGDRLEIVRIVAGG